MTTFYDYSYVLAKLSGGDLRSIGKADELVAEILEKPDLFPLVFEGLQDSSEIIRMRAADVIEKVTRRHSEYLMPYKKRLIQDVSKIDQPEVRWHLAQMYSYLELTSGEKEEIIGILRSWVIESKSKIVIVNSMQTLADLAEKDGQYRQEAIDILAESIKNGSPAIINRGKKLINKLNKAQTS